MPREKGLADDSPTIGRARFAGIAAPSSTRTPGEIGDWIMAHRNGAGLTVPPPIVRRTCGFTMAVAG
jgi:hypothetical protein